MNKKKKRRTVNIIFKMFIFLFCIFLLSFVFSFWTNKICFYNRSKGVYFLFRVSELTFFDTIEESSYSIQLEDYFYEYERKKENRVKGTFKISSSLQKQLRKVNFKSEKINIMCNTARDDVSIDYLIENKDDYNWFLVLKKQDIIKNNDENSLIVTDGCLYFTASGNNFFLPAKTVEEIFELENKCSWLSVEEYDRKLEQEVLKRTNVW